MNLLDENFPQDQRSLLLKWRIPFRQLGLELSSSGIQDPDIIPLLHSFRNVTFFTQDRDFFKRDLCHSSYSVVFLDVSADDAAEYTRRLLRHSTFDAEQKRMGKVVRVYRSGIQFWQKRVSRIQSVDWI